MLYTINSIITFRPDDGAIWINDHEESMQILTVTCSRLLKLLLENHGNVVTRDEILEKVWDAYGLRASNNSLNQYISIVRRHFQMLGITEEVITTIPKVGFVFNRIIEVKMNATESNPIPSHNILDNTAIDNDSVATQPEVIQLHKKHSQAGTALLLTCVLFSLLIGIVIFISTIEFKNHIPESKVWLLGKIGECNVYTFYQSSNEMTPRKLDVARKITANNDLNCLPNSIYIYQPDDQVSYGLTGRVFISRCTVSKSNPSQLAACKDFYDYQWK